VEEQVDVLDLEQMLEVEQVQADIEHPFLAEQN